MVEQPNQVSAGGQRLAFGYYHPGTSNIDTATWLNDTGYVRYFLSLHHVLRKHWIASVLQP